MQLWPSSKKYTVLISGASRGLGLEFTQQYAEAGWHVIACCRTPDDAVELQKLHKKYRSIAIMPLDITSASSVENLSTALAGKPIDLLINNAGIYGQPHQQLGNLDIQDLIHVYATNAIAPLKLSEALIENIKNSKLKTIVSITSLMASITDNHSGGAYSYRASKAALNMMMKTLSNDLENFGIRVLLLHPGWVQTDMGGAKAPLEAAVSVAGMRKVIEATIDVTGCFFDYQGRSLLW